ncbi:hypothetical protein GCM10010470_42690 [Saccharopolyspora taberi]|uniref:Secreted protein n=2 Tax=Saccharopolyspora taberi TaxID=60895 RepID=A0ABN3VGG8_9PSEU
MRLFRRRLLEVLFRRLEMRLFHCWLSSRGLGCRGMPSRWLSCRGLPSRGMPSRGLPSHGMPSRGLPSRGLRSRGLSSRGLGRDGLERLRGVGVELLAQLGQPASDGHQLSGDLR